jgi:hypothetical protein
VDDDAQDRIADEEGNPDGEADEESGEEYVFVVPKEGGGKEQDEKRDDLDGGERKPQDGREPLNERREGQRSNVGTAEMMRRHCSEPLSNAAPWRQLSSDHGVRFPRTQVTGRPRVVGMVQRRSGPWSLAGRRLPEFYLVSFWIDDPGKLSVFGLVDLLEHVAAFFA